MADVQEAPVWGRNSEGQVVVKLVNGSTEVVGTLGADSVPLDSTGAMVMAVGGTADGDGLGVGLVSKLAGESLEKDWIKVESGANQNVTVLSGKTDATLGSIGAASDYLKRVSAVVSNSANSRVVLKEGNPVPKKQINTHATTASTTTTLNTATNPDSVYADQYKDHMVRVGSSGYYKILSHPAFSAGAVNQFNIDKALPAVPAANVAIMIETPDLVFEILPLNVEVKTHPIDIERYCSGPGWRISTDSGVHVFCSGDYDNV